MSISGTFQSCVTDYIYNGTLIFLKSATSIRSIKPEFYCLQVTHSWIFKSQSEILYFNRVFNMFIVVEILSYYGHILL